MILSAGNTTRGKFIPMNQIRSAMKSYIILSVLVFSAGASYFAGIASAAGGSISGVVKDQTNAVIPGAMLTLTNPVLGATFKATSNGQGFYSLPGLPVGRYDVTIEASGFKPQKKTGLTIDTDSAIELNTTLESGGISDSVTV